jgi:hypothetical protein
MKTQSTSKKRTRSFYKPLVQTIEANKREGVSSSNVTSTSSKIESDQFVEKKPTHYINSNCLFSLEKWQT